MRGRTGSVPCCLASAALALRQSTSCFAFAFTFAFGSKRNVPSSLLCASFETAAEAAEAAASGIKGKPHWVPMELAELLADDLRIAPDDFLRTSVDVEVYTSCDDDGDEFHECDFFDQFLEPTKWLHLTERARTKIDEVHFQIWKDVWANPTGAVELADKVSKDCLRYYKKFMLEPRSSKNCPSDRGLVRVKVVPASFGLEGFEDAIWEATEDLVKSNTDGTKSREESVGHDTTMGGRAEGGCRRAITFVAAAPDLFTDPILIEGGGGKMSPQAEFEPDRFREFASTLREKLVMFSRMEGLRLDDDVVMTPFHPLWRLENDVWGGVADGSEADLDGRRARCRQFPYPCVVVSTEVETQRELREDY